MLVILLSISYNSCITFFWSQITTISFKLFWSKWSFFYS